MKVLFNGLGPNDTVSHDGKVYRNGSRIEMPDEAAAAYIGAKMAIPAGEDEAAALQRLETKNAARRKAVREKADSVKEGQE